MRFGEIMGCHQMPERSFYWHGYQFPVCARCTGVFLSLPITIWLMRKKKIDLRYAFLLSEIMLIDWGLQFVEIKESTNRRRLITGFLGGIGVHVIYFKAIGATFGKIAALFRENKQK